MKPIKFDGANVVFGANQPEYHPLPAERRGNPGTGEIVTCWEFSPDELKKIAETGQIWLSLLTFGQPLQPVLLSVEKPDIYDPIPNE